MQDLRKILGGKVEMIKPKIISNLLTKQNVCSEGTGVTIRKKYKNGFFVDLVDYYKPLRENGWYEHSEIETQDWVIDNVKEDWVIFDCGAHIGYYSMLFSYCAPKGKVYAFEASEEACTKFARNLDYNIATFNRPFQNIELINIALGDRVSQNLKETLYFSGKPNNGKIRSKFDFITLDHFCNSRGIEQVDLIKTDVDGWDYEVLLGCKELINKFKPIFISEVNYALGWRNHSEEDVKRFLKEINYAYKALDFPSPTNWLMYPNE